jgi:hypothetical protein
MRLAPALGRAIATSSNLCYQARQVVPRGGDELNLRVRIDLVVPVDVHVRGKLGDPVQSAEAILESERKDDQSNPVA